MDSHLLKKKKFSKIELVLFQLRKEVAMALLNFKKAVRFIMTKGPRWCTFFINTSCNRRCVYCAVWKRQLAELSTQEWKFIIDRVASFGVPLINILGGEPTLRSDLADIIKYASNKAIVNLTSNGDNFRGDNGRNYLGSLRESGLSSVTLSLHELNDLQGHIDTLLFAKKMGAIPILSTVATQSSIKHLPDVMKITNKHGILFRYSLCQTLGGVFSTDNDILRPTPEQIRNFTKIAWQQKQQTGLVTNTYEYLRSAKLYPDKWHCNNHKDYWMIVNVDGTLMSCVERPTSVKIMDILSLNNPRWSEARTADRLGCPGCSIQCYIEEEKINSYSIITEGARQTIALLRS